MKVTYNIPDMLDAMIQEHIKTHHSVPEVLYLRQYEYDLFQEWAKAYQVSRLHYYHPGLPHRVLIEWDGKVLH